MEQRIKDHIVAYINSTLSMVEGDRKAIWDAAIKLSKSAFSEIDDFMFQLPFEVTEELLPIIDFLKNPTSHFTDLPESEVGEIQNFIRQTIAAQAYELKQIPPKPLPEKNVEEIANKFQKKVAEQKTSTNHDNVDNASWLELLEAQERFYETAEGQEYLRSREIALQEQTRQHLFNALQRSASETISIFTVPYRPLDYSQFPVIIYNTRSINEANPTLTNVFSFSNIARGVFSFALNNSLTMIQVAEILEVQQTDGYVSALFYTGLSIYSNYYQGNVSLSSAQNLMQRYGSNQQRFALTHTEEISLAIEQTEENQEPRVVEITDEVPQQQSPSLYNMVSNAAHSVTQQAYALWESTAGVTLSSVVSTMWQQARSRAAGLFTLPSTDNEERVDRRRSIF